MNNKPVTKFYLPRFMLSQIECLKFLAFPQLFVSLLILKRLIVSKQERVLSSVPGQGGTQLLFLSTFERKREMLFFYLRLTVMETGI